MVVVDEARATNYIKFTLPFIREGVRITKGIFIKRLVNSFLWSYLKHTGTDVHTGYLSETMLSQIFTDETSSTTEIQNLDISRISSLGNFLDVICNLLRVWPSCPFVETFIVLSYEIEVFLTVWLLILVASLHLFDVISRESFNFPVKNSQWLTVLVECRTVWVYRQGTRHFLFKVRCFHG